ncbi:MAG: prepilin-type N-terminal cleavage/methylation domain-containing protein [Armatimonadetes bacterium]|nr:prepilin-type N-terminal cleavage/methylation domain-containing protein [Armatimonadota bacterium]
MLKQFGKQRGFTLIELLVVIAIIAILAAILFPVFARAKANANNTGCFTNLNQMGKATLTYLDDFEGYYWSSDTALGVDAQPFTKAMAKYMKSIAVYRCKSDGRKSKASDASKSGISEKDLSQCSYLCNDQLWTALTTKRLRMAEVNTASRFVLIVDDSHTGGKPYPQAEKMTYGFPNNAHSFLLANQTGRHQGTDNYVMADTHVKAMKGGAESGLIADQYYIYNGVSWDPRLCPAPGQKEHY